MGLDPLQRFFHFRLFSKNMGEASEKRHSLLLPLQITLFPDAYLCHTERFWELSLRLNVFWQQTLSVKLTIFLVPVTVAMAACSRYARLTKGFSP